jgi:hypothetical protein
MNRSLIVNRSLIAAALALALLAPVAAHACDIATRPVGDDEIKAAGLTQLYAQAGDEMNATIDAVTKPFTTVEEDKRQTTPQDLAAMKAKVRAAQELWQERVTKLAIIARCGQDQSIDDLRHRHRDSRAGAQS